MLRRVLNEDFIDQLDSDELVSQRLDVAGEEQSYPFVFLFGIDQIKKKMTPDEYVKNIKRLYRLLKRSYEICVKIKGFKEFDTMTSPVYLGTSFGVADEEEIIDDVRFKCLSKEQIKSFIKSAYPFQFAIRFNIDTRSAQSIAQSLQKIASIFYKTIKTIYGNTVKPFPISLVGVGDDIFVRSNRSTMITEEETRWLEDYDLRANVVLWSMMKKMDSERYDLSKAQREAWDYLENMHNKFGHTPFIDEIADYITAQKTELIIEDDKKNKTVTFMLPQSKRFTIKNPMEFIDMATANQYKIRIRGGSSLSLECPPKYLEYYADAIKDSTITTVWVAPTINSAMAEETIGKKGKPIDLVKYFPRTVRVELQAQPKKDPGISNKWWDAHPIDARFKVTSGIKEYHYVFYTKTLNSPVY